MLRSNDPHAVVRLERDDEPSALHLGGFLDDRLVVSASFFASPSPPVNPTLTSYQLRFMATDVDVQHRGYGAVVLTLAQDELRALGVEQLWANARDSALGFYLSQGWQCVAGSEHLSAETQIPHTVVFKVLDDP